MPCLKWIYGKNDLNVSSLNVKTVLFQAIQFSIRTYLTHR